MAKQQLLSLLRIQELANEIRVARRILDEAPQKIEEIEQRFRDRNAEYVAIKDRYEELDLDQRSRSGELVTLEDSKKKFMDDLMQVKNQREYAAMLKEIDMVKAEISGHEEAILKAEEVAREGGWYTESVLYMKALSQYMLDDYAAALTTLERTGAGEQVAEARESLAAGAPVATGDSTLNLLLRMADIGVDPITGEPVSLLAARFWIRVNPDSALVRLDRIAQDFEDTGLRFDWLDVIADTVFDEIRDDPRLEDLNARFGL